MPELAPCICAGQGRSDSHNNVRPWSQSTRRCGQIGHLGKLATNERFLKDLAKTRRFCVIIRVCVSVWQMFSKQLVRDWPSWPSRPITCLRSGWIPSRISAQTVSVASRRKLPNRGNYWTGSGCENGGVFKYTIVFFLCHYHSRINVICNSLSCHAPPPPDMSYSTNQTICRAYRRILTGISKWMKIILIITLKSYVMQFIF